MLDINEQNYICHDEFFVSVNYKKNEYRSNQRIMYSTHLFMLLISYLYFGELVQK